MENNFIAEASIVVNAPASKVWEALTNPAMVKQYLFGTDVQSDWKKGSSITYTGEWDGKKYKDKGVILEIEPEKYLLSTYWSSMSGTEDKPENYQKVGYRLTPEGERTKLIITQENAKTQEAADHSKKNWEMVLGGLKKLVQEQV
jgi:uncharacterized protein YndB with AHSA1/START domain